MKPDHAIGTGTNKGKPIIFSYHSASIFGTKIPENHIF